MPMVKQLAILLTLDGGATRLRMSKNQMDKLDKTTKEGEERIGCHR